ncbi:hypothetical protein VSR34_22315 [Paraburkholderia sp. JHI2823]|uniref:hypothetical protein n=1 Tax=Paraburkholderia sp. JHI2823 TaxID=3112960 RepID=UPI003176FCA8
MAEDYYQDWPEGRRVSRVPSKKCLVFAKLEGIGTSNVLGNIAFGRVFYLKIPDARFYNVLKDCDPYRGFEPVYETTSIIVALYVTGLTRSDKHMSGQQNASSASTSTSASPGTSTNAAPSLISLLTNNTPVAPATAYQLRATHAVIIPPQN